MKQNKIQGRPCKDHEGHSFSSIEEMCKYWKQNPDTFRRRRTVYRMSLEDALTKPVVNGSMVCYDHLGQRFRSESKMCEHWKIGRKTYRYRRKKGMSVKDALTLPVRQ